MYGLPVDIDLTFFEGKTLVQVCIGVHDLVLNFDGTVSITVTSSVACSNGIRAGRVYEDFREAAYMLFALLNHSVTSAAGKGPGTLTLVFDDGAVLEIYDDSKEYESYVIRHGGSTIVV